MLFVLYGLDCILVPVPEYCIGVCCENLGGMLWMDGWTWGSIIEEFWCVEERYLWSERDILVYLEYRYFISFTLITITPPPGRIMIHRSKQSQVWSLQYPVRLHPVLTSRMLSSSRPAWIAHCQPRLFYFSVTSSSVLLPSLMYLPQPFSIYPRKCLIMCETHTLSTY